jgi:hypothetical protein
VGGREGGEERVFLGREVSHGEALQPLQPQHDSGGHAGHGEARLMQSTPLHDSGGQALLSNWLLGVCMPDGAGTHATSGSRGA